MRSLVLKLLKITAFDFTLQHHWVRSKRVKLNSFTHKGYWYHGKNREVSVMESFGRLILPGQTVIEVGGHIGYISLYFSDLVGPSGSVNIFEPGKANLAYLKQNLAQADNVNLLELAVSDSEGEVKFYTENLSGQNNSLVADFAGLKDNAKVAGIAPTVSVEIVQAVTLDGFMMRSGIVPDFVKVDVEGAEEMVVRGMREMLKRHSPIIMIETNNTHDEVFPILREYGYVMLDEALKPYDDDSEKPVNSFGIPAAKLKALRLA